MRTFTEKLDVLPEDVRAIAIEFIDLLYNKYHQNPPVRKMNFKWAGGLDHLKREYTSIELQKKGIEWRKGS